MAKKFDYYAGYPNQQRTPKWVGLAIGSVFGGLTLIALGVGIRMAMPARSAEASALFMKPTAAAPVLAPEAAPVVAEVDDSAAVDEQAPVKQRLHGKVGKKGKKGHSVALLSHRPTKADKKFKRAQVYAKGVATSRRDKRARDDLDKMLGL
jgi:hypothetical protein